MLPVTRFKLERNARKISQHAVGVVTCIPQPVISLVENGRLTPTADQLLRLAAVFRVAPDDLLKDVVVLGPRR